MVLVLPLALFDGALRHGSPHWCYTWVLTLRPASPPDSRCVPEHRCQQAFILAHCSAASHTLPLVCVTLNLPVCSWPQSPVLGLALQIEFPTVLGGPGKTEVMVLSVDLTDQSANDTSSLFRSCMSSVTVACAFCLWCVRFLLFSFIPCFITSASVSHPLEAFKTGEGMCFRRLFAATGSYLTVPCTRQALGWLPVVLWPVLMFPWGVLLCLPLLCLLLGAPEWPTVPCKSCPQPHFLPASHLPPTSVFVSSLQFFLLPPPAPRCSTLTGSFLTCLPSNTASSRKPSLTVLEIASIHIHTR